MNTFSEPEAERVLLASILEYPEAYHQAAALGLRAEHFTDEAHRLVYRSLLQIAESGQPIAFESIVRQVRKMPGDEKLVAVLEDLTNPLHVPRKNIEWHVTQLLNAVQRTRFASVCELGINRANDRSETTTDCIENIQRLLLEIQADSSSAQASRINEFMPQVLQELQLRATKQGLIGLPTGIEDLDEATTGIRPGELWVIGALSGRGKTALGAQIALANAAADNAVAFFSLEMTRAELGDRFLCNESTVSASRIRNPSHISTAQWAEIANCAGKLAGWPLFVDDSTSLTTQSLLARARLYIRNFNCRLIIVDYLRLITSPGRELREQVGNATDALRQLAKSEHVAVIALSQLSRPRDRDVNGRPTMLGLKESGDIEAHAHVVLLIYMPAKRGERTGEDEIIIGKNRHGPVGAIEVSFSPERLKFLTREGRNRRANQIARYLKSEDRFAGPPYFWH
jgi:replicative DNA helicase